MSDDDRETAPSRRAVVNGLGTGLVAAPAVLAGGQALAQTTDGGPTGSGWTDALLQNPLEKYPKPPFPRQEQPWPGLARDMQPRPDHGETSYRGAGKLAGRKALVTGGDSGIGRAAVIAYAREGADVAINYLPPEEPDAREVVDLIRREGRKAVAIPGDIQDEAFCQRLVAEAARELGGLDILVNNAARQQARPSLDLISSADFDQTMKTNLYAMFWITKAALPHLRPGSVIINTASVVAYDPPEQIVDYAMTKAGIVNFTKGIAKQLAPKGIRVNAVAPGPFWTPLQPSGGQLPDSLPQFGADSSLKRPGQPAEIAPLYVLLAIAETSFTTGSVFGATGGEVGP
jgi:NAD(P)-dependent dehydrogenase (short-subunit alcohol dehydrogenase family)